MALAIATKMESEEGAHQLTALIERQDADGLRAFISAAAEARRNKVKVK